MDDDTRDDEQQPSRSKPEGVRIIGAEEAAAAMESGEVVRRRPEDVPRYGDVPPQPEGPRPDLRFPMPEGDPADVAKPSPRPPDLPHWTEPPSGEVPRILPADAEGTDEDDLAAWSSFTSQGPRWRDQPTDWEEMDYDDDLTLFP